VASNPESKLVARMRLAIGRAHPEVMTLKLHGSPYQAAGLPDLLCLVQGRAVWLEAKCPGPSESEERARGRVTERQAVMHDRLANAGCTVAVVISEFEAVAVLEKVIAGIE
jgi:hypothetical protein